MRFKTWLGIAALALLVSGFEQPARAETTAQWIAAQTRKSCESLFTNISPPGTARGTVVASPSKKDPNYFFHWIRDAALTMNAVMGRYESAPKESERVQARAAMLEYVDLSRANQLYSSVPGEPKFEVDGHPFTGPWGRPQNDGPALRAITLVRLAEKLMGEGAGSYVRERLYDGKLPSDSVIKTDLEFVAHHWREASIDLWEEVRGLHFYTRAVQRRSLLDGARLAERLGDGGAARFYLEQAALIEAELAKHWDGGRGYVVATLDYEGGDRGKNSNLDSAVVLGVLHSTAPGDAFMSPARDIYLATAEKIRQAFEREYAVNRRKADFDGNRIEAAIGRYPEDVYDGVSLDKKGNPWVLATSAFAEYCYRVALACFEQGSVQITKLGLPFLQAMVPGVSLHAGETLQRSDPRFAALLSGLRESGDSFLRRTKLHGNPDGALSEQINRDNGYMQGAHDLTWSYASFISASQQREQLMKAAGSP
ncbi:MAG: glycoside hydrolase family 15 protein [Deltaproteobacteria bacterium]|nr:glycoside hydrolase family 15 protein [Deltaproteobacteria bacterium]